MPNADPIRGDEMRALRKLQREQAPKSPFVFTTERNSPFSTAGFARMMERLASRPSSASRLIRTCCDTPAALRWPTRATIREPLQAYLDHRNIQHTVRYTELSPGRFKDFFR